MRWRFEPRSSRYALLPNAVTAWCRARLQSLVRHADTSTNSTRACKASRRHSRCCDSDAVGNVVHAAAKKRAEPYTKIVEELPQMRREAVQLVRQAVGAGRRAYVLVNNRAEGNAPLTVEALAGCCAVSAIGLKILLF